MIIIAILISIIISCIIYFGGGWCVYNIYLSIVDIDTLTFEQIFNSQIIVYNSVVFVINFLCVINTNKSEWLDNICLGVPVVCYFLFCKILPMSTGGAILNTVFVLLTLIICTTNLIQKLLDEN